MANNTVRERNIFFTEHGCKSEDEEQTLADIVSFAMLIAVQEQRAWEKKGNNTFYPEWNKHQLSAINNIIKQHQAEIDRQVRRAELQGQINATKKFLRRNWFTLPRLEEAAEDYLKSCELELAAMDKEND